MICQEKNGKKLGGNLRPVKMCFILGIFEVRVSIIMEIQRILLIFVLQLI